ncbi:hypothetical protein C1645_872229 [Glomus cerebriforme]|uniref:Crinkler effector protein N-terminal domain-containing protein n=1 Tax=Glomus cerebriforme TaxID=658196 RepID=A0A397TD49_9GLOM|nr:hypothetical protein C1645_872229 [Glomus cerebriforme]
MSITLLCLVKGNTLANAFPVDIDREQLAEQPQTFVNVDAKDIKLWKVPISDDHVDPLSNLSLEDISPQETTATSSREQELLEQVASCRHYLTSPHMPNKWTANIEHATLEGLKDYIRKMYHPPALENDGAELNLMNDGEKYFPHNDQDLREMLRIFVSKNNLKFTVFIETPSKALSDWSFPKVCQLYELCESDDPSLSVFPPFTCEYKDLENDSSRSILKHLIAELNARLKSIPISGNEASKSEYVCSYLVAGVKDEDFYKGIAQNAVQLESALSNRKRKASEMEEGDVFTRKTFGIITDAEKWYFMEYLQAKVERVLGHIAWLLEEAQKPDTK